MKLKLFWAVLFLSLAAYSCTDRVSEEVTTATTEKERLEETPTTEAEISEEIPTVGAGNTEYEGLLLPVARGTTQAECDTILSFIRIMEIMNDSQDGILDEFGNFRYNPGNISGECILNAGGILVAIPALEALAVEACNSLQEFLDIDNGLLFFGLVFSYSTSDGEDFCFVTSIN